ncbi:PDZ domain-containing protein [Streptomyces sp. NPDC059454]|uniref:PDZ domain-containing protein n=1 Tax=Streptomyces sp. NPDC059454 TaxID=3346836 RepID=UPI003677947A
MEQTALRPRPMPGDGGGGVSEGGGGGVSGGGPGSGPPGRHPGRRRGRRLVAALLGVPAGMLLVLSGAGLGAVGATVVGAGGLAELKRQAGVPSAAPAVAPRSVPSPPVVTRLGVEVADDRRPGALVVTVHVPGPGSSAGLVRGDVLLAFGTTRVDSAADLARAVARARPGDEVTLTVRRRSGGHQQLTAVPGIVT